MTPKPRLLMGEPDCESIQANEADRIQFALKLELLKAEFFLNGVVGLLNFVGNNSNVTSSMRVGVSLLDAEITDDIPVIGGAIDAMISEAHGECAVIQTLLYEKANQKVLPYNMTVAEFTDHISKLRNMLSKSGTKDEGIIVPISPGAYNQVNTNIIPVNHTWTLPGILRILYGTGSQHIPAGFFPRGGGGNIAKCCLKKA
nr:desiccation-related protein pcc13-62 [Quercus suber]